MLRASFSKIPRSLELANPSKRLFSSSFKLNQIQEIASMEEFKKTAQKDKYALVDFYATWCGPCKAISPIVDKLSNIPEYSDKVNFYKVDVDLASDVAMEYGVSAMPTFLFFKDGMVEKSVIGANPPAIKQLLDLTAEGKM